MEQVSEYLASVDSKFTSIERISGKRDNSIESAVSELMIDRDLLQTLITNLHAKAKSQEASILNLKIGIAFMGLVLILKLF